MLSRRLKRGFREAVLRIAPGTGLKLFSIRSRRQIERNVKLNERDKLARTVSEHTGNAVFSGPFAGMRISYDAYPVHSAPKYCGTYESELWPFVYDQLDRMPNVIINVGAADGYYAVGFARLLQSSQVYAFDADPKALRAIRSNSLLNSVDSRVHTKSSLSHKELNKVIKSRNTLIVMDVEGAEKSLMDPSLCPALKESDFIVELHHGVEPDIQEIIMDRFQTTHNIRFAEKTSLDQKRQLVSDLLDENLIDKAIEERRGHDSWAYGVCR